MVRQALITTWIAAAGVLGYLASPLVLAHGEIAENGDTSATASKWVVSDYARARLISAQTHVGELNEVRLGVQIELKPEWKTYWRHPGEAGIPPRFDWSKSENLSKASMEWPAPARYDAFGLESIGYKDNVVFPVTVALATPGRALAVDLALEYAVCRDICVPLTADMALRVSKGTAGESSFAPMIAEFAAKSPLPLPNNSISDAPELQKVCLSTEGNKKLLRVSFAADSLNGYQDLFVEAGDNFGFGPPNKKISESLGKSELLVPVYQYRKKAVLADQDLHLTLTTDNGAFEWRAKLCSD